MTDHMLKGENNTNLQVLVSFLISNYIPMWFTIKKLGKAQLSSQVLYKQIQLANKLKGPIVTIVKQNEARNTYMLFIVRLFSSACCVTLTLGCEQDCGT